VAVCLAVTVAAQTTSSLPLIEPIELDSYDASTPTVYKVPFSATFLNPCTLEDVAVDGASTITLSDSVTPQGDRRIAVSVATKGTGIGLLSGVSYSFMENQQFIVRAPLLGEEFDSVFQDKFQLRGAKSIDNWVVRAHFRLKIDAGGNVLVQIERLNTDGCKG
jgi:hypothetical protein